MVGAWGEACLLETNEEEGGQEAGADDAAVGEEFERDEGFPGEESLIDREEYK